MVVGDCQRIEEVILRLQASIVRTGISSRDIFARLDVNQTGTLSCEQVIVLFTQLQGDLSSAECRCLFQILDKDGNGEVDVDEFCALLEPVQGSRHGFAFSGELADDVKHRQLPSGNAQGVIQRLATTIVRMGVEPRDLFRRLDANADRQLSVDELDRLILQFQPDLSVGDRRSIFQHFDLDGSCFISSAEFLQTLACAVLDAASAKREGDSAHKEEGIRVDRIVSRLRSSLSRMGVNPRDLFCRLDLNRDGQISLDELERLTLQLQPDLSHLERQMLFQKIDADCSGLIDLREFCNVFEPEDRHYRQQSCGIQDGTRGAFSSYGCRGTAVLRA